MALGLFERATLAIVRRSKSPEAAVLGLQKLEKRLPSGRQGLMKALELSNRNDWPARYLAGKVLGRYIDVDADAVVRRLVRLAEDKDRFVREGSAFGLGTAWSNGDAAVREMILRVARDEGPAQRRAVAFSTVAVMRNSQDLDAEDIVPLLEESLKAAGPKDTRQIGRQIVGQTFASEAPELAMKFVERWAAGGSATLRREATASLSDGLREAFPERVAAAEALLNGHAEDDRPTEAVNAETKAATTESVEIPESLIEHVIGQDEAVDLVRIAARQRRYVLLVGEPGTGKSMLASAMSEILPARGLTDILVYPNKESRVSPIVEEVPAGEGQHQVSDAKRRQKTAETSVSYIFWVGAAAAAIIAAFFAITKGNYLFLAGGGAAILLLFILRRAFRSTAAVPVPKLLVNNANRESAPFVDATGFHAGALLGDVRHDPFQSGGYETPAHQLVEAGAIHVANGGVLFIDEVATLGMESQQSLLSAIQERRFAISGRSPGSSGSMVRTGPIPCDFVVVIAGNMQDIEKMHPALRSRIRGAGYEIYMNESMDDAEENIAQIVRFVAQEVGKDGRISHFSGAAVDAIMEQCRLRSGRPHTLTLRLRELGGLVRAAGDLARVGGDRLVEARHVEAAIPNARSLEEQIADRETRHGG
jgi:energy-coupling factor transporter ATP-binding protein EcfA2